MSFSKQLECECPAVLYVELEGVRAKVMKLLDRQEKLQSAYESALEYEKRCLYRDHEAVLAVDISASTQYFNPYYERVETIYNMYKPTLTLVWDTTCLFASNFDCVLALRKREEGTEAECLLEYLKRLSDYNIKKLIIVTDAQFGKVSIPEIDRLNIAYPLKNIETLTMFFVGEPRRMTTSIENMFYRPHMTKLEKGDNPKADLINVCPGKPLNDSDDLYSDDVLNTVVYAAKNYAQSDFEKLRSSLLSLAAATRRKDKLFECENKFVYLCKSKEAEKCKKHVEKNGRSDRQQQDCDSRASFLLRILEEKKNLYSASFLRGKYVPESEYLHEELTTFREVDPITLEGCEGALTFFLTSRPDDVSNVEKDPLNFMRLHCGKRVEKQLYSYKTYKRLQEAACNLRSPITRRTVCGTFVLDFGNAFEHNSHSLAMFVNGIPKLYGMRGLWHVAFCYFLSKQSSFSQEVKLELQKYARIAASATKCRAALDGNIDPRWKCSVADALWYVVNVASLFESSSMNVCRSYPEVDLCDLYAFCCEDASVSEEIKQRHALYRTKSKVYSLRCVGNKEKAREEAYKNVRGVKVEKHGVLVAVDLVDKKAVSELAYLLNGKMKNKFFGSGDARVYYDTLVHKDWENLMSHVTLDRDKCRHSNLCKITGKNWLDCWKENSDLLDARRFSFFEVLFRFMKERQRYPSDEYELARYHQKTRMNDYDEVLYSTESLKALAKVIDAVKVQLKDLSCEDICKRRSISS